MSTSAAPIVLCGFPVSNYYNKVKLALLEKGVDFAEEDVRTGRSDEATLAASPLAKIPFVRTAHGTLCESQAIVEWIEAAFPAPPLLPADPFAAAKVRELCTFVDLHLELVARELYGQAFFGGTLAPEAVEAVRRKLETNIAAFRRIARFAPFVAGADFTLADCSAWPSLSLVAMATKAVLGQDLLAAGGIDWKAYNQALAERPSVQRVAADRKAAQAPAPASTPARP